VLEWKKSTWYYTPASSYADMTGLQELASVKLVLSANAIRRGGNETAQVTVSNPSSSLAFFIHLQIKKGRSDEDVLPVVWQDNYFTLMPGEKRDVTATYNVLDLGTASPVLAVEGWNSPRLLKPIAGKR